VPYSDDQIANAVPTWKAQADPDNAGWKKTRYKR